MKDIVSMIKFYNIKMADRIIVVILMVNVVALVNGAPDTCLSLRAKLSMLQASFANVFCSDWSFWQVFGSRRHSYSFLSPTLAGEHFLVHAPISHWRWLTRMLKYKCIILNTCINHNYTLITCIFIQS